MDSYATLRELSKTNTDNDDPDYNDDNDQYENDDDDEYDDNDGDDNNNDGGGKCSLVTTTKRMRVMPGQGLYYRDDDALLDEVFDEDYVEKNFSSIPNEAACDCNHNRIMGGPQPPINASNGDMRMYKAQRKAYTVGQCRKVLNSLSAVAIKTSPVKSQATTEYTGDQYPHIRLMTAVECLTLMAGHTFSDKNTL
jgi:hypothetical protein